jgi:hypothetical protein
MGKSRINYVPTHHLFHRLPKLVQGQTGSMGGMGMPVAAKPPMPNQPKDAPPTFQKKQGKGMGRWTMGT